MRTTRQCSRPGRNTSGIITALQRDRLLAQGVQVLSWRVSQHHKVPGPERCARTQFQQAPTVGGTHLNFFIFKQLPILSPRNYRSADLAFIVPRVLELTYTAHDLRPWFEDVWNSLGDTPEGDATRDRIRAAWAESHGQLVPTSPLHFATPSTPFAWNPDRRARLRAELDAWSARLYGLTRDELRYLLDPADVHGPDYPSETFRVLKHSESRKFDEYCTQRLVLEA